VETPPPVPSPWEPLRRLSRWPLVLLMAFLSFLAFGLFMLALEVLRHSREDRAGAAIMLAFIAVGLLGIRKLYRFERGLARLQAEPSSEALADFIRKAWTTRAQQGLSPEEGWLDARPRLRLVAIAGITFFLGLAAAYFYSAATEYLRHYYDRPWRAPLAMGAFTLFGAGVFFQLFRCASKLSPENLRLAEAMEHYRCFHNYGFIFAFGIAWAFFCSILM